MNTRGIPKELAERWTVSVAQIVDAHARPSRPIRGSEWPDSPEEHVESSASVQNTDHRVLERFLPDVLARRLEPEALVLVATLVQSSDVKYFVPVVDAVAEMLQLGNAELADLFRFREWKNVREALAARKDIRHQLKEMGVRIGGDLREERELPGDHPESHMRIIRALKAMEEDTEPHQ